MPQGGYRDLTVWQVAMDLVVESHRVADSLPPSQRFALSPQIRRAAISVPANIAEGYGRVHRGDYIRHLSIARGSARELETHLEIVTRLGYASSEAHERSVMLADRVSRLLLGMTRRMGAR